jgi:predicted nucleotide-binding protein (sugar kinase/HSP70/actin superfamily)
VPIRISPRWFAAKRSVEPSLRAKLRIGIPKVLNVWSTHQFWIGFFSALGIEPNAIVFSSDTSEEQSRQFGKGRGTVDCCYPVKCASGHYGELIFGQRKKIDVLFSPMIFNLPSVLAGQVIQTLSCPRVMALPENIKAGFTKEKDLFAENDIRHVTPLVSLGDPEIVPKQLYDALADVFPGLTLGETKEAVFEGYQTLEAFNRRLRRRGRQILEWCARENRPCLLILARPYHMDSGIGHEIEVDLQVHGYPVMWTQHLPTDADLMHWLFRREIQAGIIRSPFDIADVWPSSYSANTNEILWGAKIAARLPWIACVIRLSSYECGMDQPTYTPVQQIVERSGTLFFSFQELDSTKPAGSVKIRVETIAHYLEKYSSQIVAAKKASAAANCPFPCADQELSTHPDTSSPSAPSM